MQYGSSRAHSWPRRSGFPGLEGTSLAVEQSNWFTGNREFVRFSRFGTGFWSFFPAVIWENTNGMARAVNAAGTEIRSVKEGA